MMQSRTAITRFSTAGIRYYSGKEFAAEDTQKLLAKFQGGNIKLSKNDETGIATICLQQPEKKNAISGQMLLDLKKAVEELENWENGKGFIMHGSNNIFSSGGDLAMARGTASEECGYSIAKYVQDITSRLKNLPMVSVALIEGVALGGGAELSVAACDWRIITPDAKIGFVHSRMGITPGWGGGTALKHLVGKSIALDLITSGRLVNATEALQLKLVNAILESSLNSIENAENWLKHRIGIPTEVLRACKCLIYNEESFAIELQHETSIHAPLWGGKAKIEALNKNIKHK